MGLAAGRKFGGFFILFSCVFGGLRYYYYCGKFGASLQKSKHIKYKQSKLKQNEKVDFRHDVGSDSLRIHFLPKRGKIFLWNLEWEQSERYNDGCVGTITCTFTLDKNMTSVLDYTYRDTDGDFGACTDVSTFYVVNDDMIRIRESDNFEEITLRRQGDNIYYVEIGMILTKAK